MFLPPIQSTDPRYHDRYVLSEAYLQYGHRKSPIVLSPRWDEVSPAFVKDHISVLCREISEATGGMLSPAFVYKESGGTPGLAEMITEANAQHFDHLSESLKAQIAAMPVYLVISGSGFGVKWAPADEEVAP